MRLVVKRFAPAPGARAPPLVIATKTPPPHGEVGLIFETPDAWTGVVGVGDVVELSSLPVPANASPGAAMALSIRGISASKAGEVGPYGEIVGATTVIASAADGLFLGARGEAAEFIIEQHASHAWQEQQEPTRSRGGHVDRDRPVFTAPLWLHLLPLRKSQ